MENKIFTKKEDGNIIRTLIVTVKEHDVDTNVCEYHRWRDTDCNEGEAQYSFCDAWSIRNF